LESTLSLPCSSLHSASTLLGASFPINMTSSGTAGDEADGYHSATSAEGSHSSGTLHKRDYLYLSEAHCRCTMSVRVGEVPLQVVCFRLKWHKIEDVLHFLFSDILRSTFFFGKTKRVSYNLGSQNPQQMRPAASTFSSNYFSVPGSL
jgi:hypothetical protein